MCSLVTEREYEQAYADALSREHLLVQCCQNAPSTKRFVLKPSKLSIILLLESAFHLVWSIDGMVSLCSDEKVPEHYRWPLLLKRKQKQRHQLYESPPKRSLLTFSVIDTVALSPTVNFVEHEEYDAHLITIQPKACTC